MSIIASSQYTLSEISDGANGLTPSAIYDFYQLSNSETVPNHPSENFGLSFSRAKMEYGVWQPYVHLTNRTSYIIIDIDSISKDNIVVGEELTWMIEISFDGVTLQNSTTNNGNGLLTVENWITNASDGKQRFNPLGVEKLNITKVTSDPSQTSVNNYFLIKRKLKVSQAIYDLMKDGTSLTMRIRLDNVKDVSYHWKTSYLTYGSSIPSSSDQNASVSIYNTGWEDQPLVVTENKKYLWQYLVYHYPDGTEKALKPTIVAVKGKDGVNGSNGKDGRPGADGLGIKNTVISYAVSTSGTTPPSSGWSSNPPTVPKGQYLATRLQYTYTNNLIEYVYYYSYMGKDGNNGNNGIPGKDGVSVTNTTVSYAISTSGTNPPSTGWQSTPPSVPQGQYMCVRMTLNYSDGKSENVYNYSYFGKNGANGATGPKGDTGPTGPKGDKGTDGKNGTNGKDGTFVATHRVYHKVTNSLTEPTVANMSKPYSIVYGGINYYANTNWKPSVTKERPSTITRVSDSNVHYGMYYRVVFEHDTKATDGGILFSDPTYGALNNKDIAAGTTISVGTWIRSDTKLDINWYGHEKVVVQRNFTIPGDNTWHYYNFTDIMPESSTYNNFVIYFANQLPNGATVDVQYPRMSIGKNSEDQLNTNEDLGWTTGSVQPTASNRYLWEVTQTVMSDGKAYQSAPTIVGVYGEKGEKGDNGVTYYTWIAWAEDNNGKNFSTTSSDSRGWIGIATNKTTETKSTNWKDYTWTKLTSGTEGGNENLLWDTDVPSLNKVMAPWNRYFSDNDNLKSKFVPLDDPPLPSISFAHETTFTNKSISSNGSKLCFYADGGGINLINGKQYTLSCYARIKPSDSHTSSTVRQMFTIGKDNYWINNTEYYTVTKSWKKFSFTFTYNSLENGNRVYIGYWYDEKSPDNTTYQFCGYMLNEGNIPGTYSISSKELQAYTASKLDADEFEAYQKERSKFEQEIREQAEAAAKALEEIENWRAVYNAWHNNELVSQAEASKFLTESNLKDVKEIIDLKQSKIVLDGITNKIDVSGDGVILKKSDGSKSLEITSDGMYMFGSDAKTAVAYINDNTLKINSGVFINRLQLGKMMFEPYNDNMIVIRKI